MSDQESLRNVSVAISISESDDMSLLGFAEEHFRDAMMEVARHLLAMGIRLIYGGDLRSGGFTELLFELVIRHYRNENHKERYIGVVNYQAFPVHSSVAADEHKAFAKDITGIAEIYYLNRTGDKISPEELEPVPITPSKEDWDEGPTAMRSVIVKEADAHIILGGRAVNYKGRIPGIAEETFLALQKNQPVFLLGGFGGCARGIAEEMNLLVTKTPTASWHGREIFAEFANCNLNNGLTEKENRVLVRTPHIDEAVALILRGLLRSGLIKRNLDS